VIVLGLLLFSSSVWAQSVASGSISGVVRDESGAVLPGVTVEAESPALIEKVRSAVTDGQGIYRIVDLRPGVYAVSFTLPGFNPMRREGVELSVGTTASVNIELTVGSLQEMIVVTAAAPLVDTQNIIQQATVTREVRDALPLPSNSGAYVVLIPAATQTSTNRDVGGNMGENRQQFNVHGSRTNDFQQLRDGQFFGTMVAAGNFMSSVNPTTVEEINILTGGGLTAESESGGAQINVISKSGGNVFSGAIHANFSDRDFQSDNLDESLQARGATTAPYIKQNYEFAGGLGGPVKRDRLWFFGSGRRWIIQSYQPNNYFNATQGTMFYTPDQNRPAYEDNFYNEGTGRITWQATQAHKITGMYSSEYNCNCYFGIQAGTLAPEATGDDLYDPNWRTQVTWTAPATNRVLLEGGLTVVEGVIVRRLTGGSYDDISILDQNRNYRYGSAGGSITGFTQSWGNRASAFGQYNIRFSSSYVTGSHALKAGVQFRRGHNELDLFIPGNQAYTFRGTSPQSVTYYAGPYQSAVRQYTVGLFAQDQWTIGKTTLSLGLRYDSLKGSVPAQTLPAGDFVGERSFDAVPDALNWKDISPRVGVAHDLFGNGKTAIKAFLGRYVGFQSNGGLLTAQNPSNAMVLTASRNWQDDGDYIPETAELGPLSPSNFGQLTAATSYDPRITHGWHNRDYGWQTSLSLQQELLTGLALNVGYFRTQYGNFSVTDNRSVTPDDYDHYCVPAPLNELLPGGGGYEVCGLYNITQAAFSRPQDNLVRPAADFGDQQEIFNGLDLTINARLTGRGQIAGGLAIGRTLFDNCEIVVDSPQQQFCRNTTTWGGGTQFKLSAVYTLPWELRASGNYQNIPGIQTTASLVVNSALASPSLGRPLSGGANATAIIELIEPGTEYLEGRNQSLSLRISRQFRRGPMRIEPQLDLFNVFNANDVLAMTTRYGDSWRNVTGVLAPRVVKLGVQVDF
jgi:hypothetical protein